MLQCDNDFPATNGDGCNTDCEVEDGWVCGGGTSTTPDTCVRTQIPEILYINVTDYNNAIVEFTEEISFKVPIKEDDFDLEIITSNGTRQYVSFVLPDDAMYFLPSKTVPIFIYQENFTELSQDTHSRIQITYKGTKKVYNSNDLELLTGSTASNYINKEDPNWLY